MQSVAHHGNKDRQDAYSVGSTSTSANYITRDTFTAFECTDGKPTYSYSYAQVIRVKSNDNVTERVILTLSCEPCKMIALLNFARESSGAPHRS